MPYEAIGGLRPLGTALDNSIKGPDARGACRCSNSGRFPRFPPYRLDANVDYFGSLITRISKSIQ